MSKRDPKFDLTPHEQDQLTHVLEHMTAEDRIVWAEQVRLMFGTDHLKKSIELRWKLAEEPHRLSSPKVGKLPPTNLP